MNIEDFISDLAEQLDDTDINELSPTTKFQNLDEWSSLTAMCIISMAKTNYNKLLTGREIRNCETIQDLYNLVINK